MKELELTPVTIYNAAGDEGPVEVTFTKRDLGEFHDALKGYASASGRQSSLLAWVDMAGTATELLLVASEDSEAGHVYALRESQGKIRTFHDEGLYRQAVAAFEGASR